MSSITRKLSFVSFAMLLFMSAFDAAAQQEKPVNSPLRILSKPNAVYPVKAQRAMVTGDVRLRISFLADGSIGEIECVNPDATEKLLFEEYGLIESAVTAARKIQFEPKIIDGKPVGVRATLGYLFRMR